MTDLNLDALRRTSAASWDRLRAEVRRLRAERDRLRDGIADEVRRADNAGLPGFRNRLRSLLDDNEEVRRG